MIPIPKWAMEFMRGRVCPHCEEAADLSCVYGVGVRQRIEEHTEQVSHVLTIEYTCPHCGKKSIFLAEPDDESPTAIDLYKSVLETLEQARKTRTVSRNSESRISNKEIQDLKRAMDNASSFEEILRYIGLSDFEIEEPHSDDEQKASNPDQ